METGLPSVSVVVPARDAARVLPRALDAIAGQTYPNIIEVIVASADEATTAAAGDAIVVDNAAGTTPVGLNRAIARSTGDVIVRCDAHSVLPGGYVTRAVETLRRTGADNVGGMQVPVGTSFWGRAIASAMSSPLGAGDARYRIGGQEGPVETVYLGVFRREVLERLGGFDERFERGQDYELNHRIREAGGIVYFDPELRVQYQPRASLVELARQYYRYGRAKRLMWSVHPGSLRARQKLVPLAVSAIIASAVGGIFSRELLWVPLSYLTVLIIGALTLGGHAGLSRVAAPIAISTMHVAWAMGFIWFRSKSDRKP